MSLQLIVGSAGSGKTTWLNQYMIEESVRNPEKTYLILVPEQFTMETQRMIVQSHPRNGMLNLDVLSFVRLAHKVFAEMGCEDYVVLDDMGKCVLLQKAALKQADSLPVFGRNLKKRGFISELKSMLSELYQYGISPEQLETAKGQLPTRSILSGKLGDMIAVYRAFIGELEEKTINAEEILPLMCHFLPESMLVRQAVIALDGFTGFTPVQYQVLHLLLQYGAKVLITVTADPLMDYRKELAPHELFHLSHHTVHTLLELAKEQEIETDPDICFFRNSQECALAARRETQHSVVASEETRFARTSRNNSMDAPPLTRQLRIAEGNRFTKAPQLAFLEQHILRYGKWRYTGDEKAGAVDSLQMYVYTSPAQEVCNICEEIYNLVMNRGYRYREIAVITGNLERYAPLFKKELQYYGIPFFIDQKNNLMHHPLTEYIRGLFEVINRDFSYESVFRLLKCGLGNCSREDRDYLENYVIALGIRGHKKWGETWKKPRRRSKKVDFERLNQIREQVAVPLLSLRERWKEKGVTVRSRIETLVQFLQEEKIEEQLMQQRQVFLEQGEILLAGEYEQAYERVMELLNEIQALMGNEVMSLQDFAVCFDSGMEEIRVGLIPACMDRLLVGDMERTRLSGVKVLFFAGVNEGQVPKNTSGGGIFTDYDREKLLSCEIELAPTGRMSSFQDRFYLYLALTRPSDHLYISYVKNDGEGKAMRPASCLGELAAYYPSLRVLDGSEIEKEIAKRYSTEGIWRYMVQGLSAPEQSMADPIWMQIYCYFYQTQKESVVYLLKAVLDGYQEESLTEELAQRLYGQALQASVSRLEQQAACAFSHFLRYGLKLEEREVFSFETTDMGTLFHSALEKYFGRIKEEHLDISAIEEAKRKELVHSCVQDAAREQGNEALQDNARNRWLAGKLERITDRTVWALGEQLKEGGYETDGCEVVFDAEHTEAFQIQLTPELRMLLSGRIDRIDTRQEEDKLYVRVVDYKSGSRTFDLVSVYYGLQIQLVFYMEAVQECFKKQYVDTKIIPGGVLYYNIKDPIVERSPDMQDLDVTQAILEQLQMNGIVTRSSLEPQEQEKIKEKKADRKIGKIAVVQDEQFTAMQNHVHETIRTLGLEIMQGQISVNPYKKGQITACTWCRYQSICGFDQKMRGYAYRNLASMSKEQVWERMMEDEGEEDGEKMDASTGTGD